MPTQLAPAWPALSFALTERIEDKPVPETTAGTQNKADIKGLLIDLEGVVCVGDEPLPGSLEAIRRIRQMRIPFKFITNTTRRSRRRIVSDLVRLGLDVAMEDVFTPAALTRDLLERQNLAPFLIIHPDLREDFEGLKTDGGEAVVIGDAGAFFTFDLLNQAYRKILNGAAFLALAKNRNFVDRDGELSLDTGAFVAALEYASGNAATVLGKPAPAFFKAAVESIGCPAENVVMIGDDAEADVGGAMAAGLEGILVQTGKYRPGQETHLLQQPTHMVANLKAAVELLFG
jgi:HAD superfamily hydrolase (TIGR01458 family)